MPATSRMLFSIIGVALSIGTHTPRLGAEELLVYGDAELLGVAHPNRDSAQFFVTCQGKSIKPIIGEIRETAQRCGNPPLVWFVISNERSRQALQAVQQKDPQAAQQALVQARESLNQAQELVQDTETQEFFARQQESLQEAEQALKREDFAASLQALREQAQQSEQVLMLEEEWRMM